MLTWRLPGCKKSYAEVSGGLNFDIDTWCMLAAKALASLRICDLPEHSLIVDA